MTIRNFRLLQMLFAAIIAAALSEALILHNYWYALVAVLVVAISVSLRRSIKEVVTDERDQQLRGQAANWTVTIFGAVTVGVALVFLYQEGAKPEYRTIGLTLIYALVGLLVLNNVLLGFFRKDQATWKRVGVVVLTIILALAAEILASTVFRK